MAARRRRCERAPRRRIASICARLEREILGAADASRARPGYAGLLGYSVFGYLEGWEARPVRLEVAAPSDWPVFTTLGAIITLIAFLPLVILIFTDKNIDPQTKKVAGGVGAVLAVVATLIGVSYNPPSVEQYTQDMNTCAAQIKAGQPTTACSPDVAAQAQEIATDSATVTAATKDAEHPAGRDVVYWIAPENGAKKSETPHVFHLCAGVSPLNGKSVNSGSVTEAYTQNATRITKQIEMEQKQCGFSVSQ